MMTVDQIVKYFTYQPPEPDQIVEMTKIRDAAKELALCILDNSPSSADQTAAIRKLRECVMTANLAIMFRGQ